MYTSYLTGASDKDILQYYSTYNFYFESCRSLVIHTDIKKTFTPWSSVSMAVIRTPFSLALSTCICGQSLVLRINRRLPWVLITGRILQRKKQTKAVNYRPQLCSMALRWNGSLMCLCKVLQKPVTDPLSLFNQRSKLERIFRSRLWAYLDGTVACHHLLMPCHWASASLDPFLSTTELSSQTHIICTASESSVWQ